MTEQNAPLSNEGHSAKQTVTSFLRTTINSERLTWSVKADDEFRLISYRIIFDGVVVGATFSYEVVLYNNSENFYPLAQWSVKHSVQTLAKKLFLKQDPENGVPL